ncbi:MAG: hypothetical protein H0V29_07170 [Thermoleophilaceae bacterium]|nr:hypothetical protein [Thermoleophilaceae bacterium]
MTLPIAASAVNEILVLGAVVIGVVAVGGSRVLGARPQLLEAPAFARTPLLPAVLLCIGLAALAGEIGLAAIIGAFLAGMLVAVLTTLVAPPALRRLTAADGTAEHS